MSGGAAALVAKAYLKGKGSRFEINKVRHRSTDIIRVILESSFYGFVSKRAFWHDSHSIYVPMSSEFLKVSYLGGK